MRRATPFALCALLLPGALALGACSSPSAPAAAATKNTAPNAGQSSAQLTSGVRSALASAAAVHVKGSTVDSGQIISLDLQLNKSGTGSGTITILATATDQAATFSVLAVNGNCYVLVDIDASTFADEGASAAQPGPGAADKWALSTSDVIPPQASAFSQYLNFSGFLTQVAGIGDTFAADGTATVANAPAAQYKDTSSADESGSVLSVPASGPELPLQMIQDFGSTGSYTVTFAWDQPTTVTAPPADEIYSGS